MFQQPTAQSVESESLWRFGLKWSSAGVVLALFLLAGCSAFTAEDTPRYNTIVGERRAPQLNVAMMQQQAPQMMQEPQRQAMPMPQQPAPQMMQEPMQSQPRMQAPVVQQPMPQPVARPVVGTPMLNQMEGDFRSAPAREYPELQPLPENPRAQNQSALSAELEAEILAMERELDADLQRQNALPMGSQMQSNTSAQSALQATPKLQSPYVVQPDRVPLSQTNAMADPQLLPPPPAMHRGAESSATNEMMDFTRQPLPASDALPTMSAPPVIDDATAAAHHQQTAPTLQSAYVPQQPVDVSDAPSVYGSPTPLQRPAGLTPPSRYRGHQPGYLPSSRYQGRFR